MPNLFKSALELINEGINPVTHSQVTDGTAVTDASKVLDNSAALGAKEQSADERVGKFYYQDGTLVSGTNVENGRIFVVGDGGRNDFLFELPPANNRSQIQSIVEQEYAEFCEDLPPIETPDGTVITDENRLRTLLHEIGGTGYRLGSTAEIIMFRAVNGKEYEPGKQPTVPVFERFNNEENNKNFQRFKDAGLTQYGEPTKILSNLLKYTWHTHPITQQAGWLSEYPSALDIAFARSHVGGHFLIATLHDKVYYFDSIDFEKKNIPASLKNKSGYVQVGGFKGSFPLDKFYALT